MPFGLHEKRLARRLARRCWIDAKANRDQAERLFRARAADYGLDPMTILLILRIAIELWALWQKWNLSDPGEDMNRQEIFVAASAPLQERLEAAGQIDLFSGMSRLREVLEWILAHIEWPPRDEFTAAALMLYDKHIVPLDIPGVPNRFVEAKVDAWGRLGVAALAEYVWDQLAKAE